MSVSVSATAARPPFDAITRDIARYASRYRVTRPLARETAHLCLLDALGCAFEARGSPDCMKLVGPVVPGTVVPNGARVPGTPYVLDPVEAAFGTAALIRWLDYNDAYYGETVIHPSDCLGALIAVADWVSRTRVSRHEPPLDMSDLLDATVRAYEIAGSLAVNNAFTTKMGIDHVILIKVACAAVAAALMGGSEAEVANAVSNAWLDGHPLATFRRGPEAGSRKSWAAADAAARGVWLALVALRGEMGYPAALSAKTWGFNDVLNRGAALATAGRLGSAVIEQVQFKLSYPAAFHAQTLAEAAIRLHPLVRGRIEQVAAVELHTHRYARTLLDRNGELRNVAERDHSLQYIAAVSLLTGNLTAADYEDPAASDPRIAPLRARMTLAEDPQYTRGFNDPARRANANAIRVRFRDGSATPRVEVEFPVGHPRRRAEAYPLLLQKFAAGVARVYAQPRARELVQLATDRGRLAAMPVHAFLDLLQGP